MTVKVTHATSEVEKCWSQILAVLIGNLASITEGLLCSWPSPFLVSIVEDKENYNISEEHAAYFDIITPLATVIACPIFSELADKIGRKRTLMLIVIPEITAWLIKAFATNVYQFYIARIFAGAANSCLFAVLSVYVGEITNPEVRGIWGNTQATCTLLGQLLMNIIGSYFSVRATSFICLPLPILFLVLFAMMPETPYYYVMKGDEEEAKKSLRFLKRKKNVETELIQTKSDIQRQLSESGTWLDLFKIRSNRRALIAGIFLIISQQTAGFTVFLVYTQLVFQKLGGHPKHNVASIIYMTILLILNIIVIYFVIERFERKLCYVVSLAASAAVLYIMATFLYLESNSTLDLSLFAWIPLACIITHQIFGSFGVLSLPTLMIGELFSVSITSKAMMTVALGLGLGNVVVHFSIYYLNACIGYYAPFYFFAICGTIGTILASRLVPETKGKSLEEIQQILKK